MRLIFRRAWLFFAVILAGCGTLATPVWQATTPTAVSIASVNDAQSAVQPTLAPTDTPIPPTPTLEPTVIPTEEPTPTIEPTTEQVASPIDRLVSVRDAENGAILFEMFQADAGFACSTCHRVDSEAQLIGPGLLNLKDRALDRVEGQSAAEYVYNSIINPNDFIVDGFPEEVMPENWSDIYSDTEIFDIVAYLMTLEGESVAEEPSDNAETTETVDASGHTTIPDTADAENGAILFETFQPDAGFACSTCHLNDSENRLIGPGLLNIGSRAETRVDGQSAVQYLYTSIVNPSDFVVPEYPDGLMPPNWAEIYSEDEIYDILAYLVTLGDGPTTDTSTSSENTDSTVEKSDTVSNISLPDTVDAENGEALFQLFQPEASFACSTCHFSDSENRLIGPGLLNIATRAETRVAGQSALDYIFTSITNPSDFVVPEYPDDLMPKVWSEIYSEDEIYDIIAYLLTLQ